MMGAAVEGKCDVELGCWCSVFFSVFSVFLLTVAEAGEGEIGLVSVFCGGGRGEGVGGRGYEAIGCVLREASTGLFFPFFLFSLFCTSFFLFSVFPSVVCVCGVCVCVVCVCVCVCVCV